MKNLFGLILFSMITIVSVCAAESNKLELQSAAIFVDSRSHLIQAWKEQCEKLNPVKKQYFESTTTKWLDEHSKLIKASNEILLGFKSLNAELYEIMKRDLYKEVAREQTGINITHQLEHCDKFFLGVAENKQDIKNVNKREYSVLIHYMDF